MVTLSGTTYVLPLNSGYCEIIKSLYLLASSLVRKFPMRTFQNGGSEMVYTGKSKDGANSFSKSSASFLAVGCWLDQLFLVDLFLGLIVYQSSSF